MPVRACLYVVWDSRLAAICIAFFLLSVFKLSEIESGQSKQVTVKPSFVSLEKKAFLGPQKTIIYCFSPCPTKGITRRIYILVKVCLVSYSLASRSRFNVFDIYIERYVYNSIVFSY